MRFATVACAAAIVSLLQAGALAAAEPEPVIHDCLEGAGDDLKSVNWEDLKFPPTPVPTG
jgi:hypothetical protein